MTSVVVKHAVKVLYFVSLILLLLMSADSPLVHLSRFRKGGILAPAYTEPELLAYAVFLVSGFLHWRNHEFRTLTVSVVFAFVLFSVSSHLFADVPLLTFTLLQPLSALFFFLLLKGITEMRINIREVLHGLLSLFGVYFIFFSPQGISWILYKLYAPADYQDFIHLYRIEYFILHRYMAFLNILSSFSIIYLVTREQTSILEKLLLFSFLFIFFLLFLVHMFSPVIIFFLLTVLAVFANLILSLFLTILVK